MSGPHGGEDGSVRLGDGRRIGYRTYGARNGAPLIALHGTPGSRLKFTVTDGVARELGLTVIAPDRWGYGLTDIHPAPSLAAFAADMEMFTDRLGLDRFAVLGVSGGGPFAAATAATLSKRVSALALVAPVGPIAGEEDSEITWFHRVCFGPFARNPWASRLLFAGFRRLLGVSRDFGMRVAMARVCPADRRTLRRPGIAARLGDCFIEGLRPGVAGPTTDLSLFAHPWDVKLPAAEVPACLWIGSADRNVPISAARRLATRLPDCRLIVLPEQGHLWVAQHYSDVLGWIADAVLSRASRAPTPS